MQKATLLCIATAVALAGTSMTADAAQRTLTKQQQAAVARIKQNTRNFQAPRTAKDAERTVVTTARGTQATVSQDLYNQMAVTRDANGNMKVVEIDGTETTAPAAEVLSNE